MQPEEAIAALHAFDEKRYAIEHAMSLLYVDGYTAAPKESWRGRSRTTGYLSSLAYEAASDPRLREAVLTVLEQKEIDARTRRLAVLLRDDMEDMLLFPREEYIENQKLLSEAGSVWHEAKEKSDYALFAPYLDKIIAYKKRYASLKDSSSDAYDVILDSYQKGLCTKTLDAFFTLVRSELTPLIRRISQCLPPRTDFLHREYPIHLQRVFCARVMDMLGIDPGRCTLGETEHPFTEGINKWDVRVTTRYRLKDPAASMYSVIHECGHALYELGVDDDLQFTRLAGGSSMGIHESQSRFYENLIGRSLAFSKPVFSALRELFPEQTADATVEDWYRGVNCAFPSLIRTEADELTYPIHVLIRYEMEKQMISGSVPVRDLPDMWNTLYDRYLGIRPSNDREGILQDSHWSTGLIGYFPGYALGSAYGVQMLRSMEKDVDVWGAAECGDLRPVTEWLRSRIHRFGKSLTPDEILRSADVSPFDPMVYVDYLKTKYSALYSL